MKKLIVLSLVMAVVAGCGVVRLEPNETQKQNAWLHNRTAVMAAKMAQGQQVSPELEGLTRLGELQSRAIAVDYGQPKDIPAAWSVEQILAQGSFDLAETALGHVNDRLDTWDVADGLIEAGIGIAGLFGGAWAIGLVGFLRKVKIKSNALREVVVGNEIFKKQNISMTQAFKTAHKEQSSATRQLVAQLKQGDR